MKKIMAALLLSFACSLTAFGQDEKIETEATPTPTPEIQKSYTEDDVGEFIDSVESGDAAMVRRFLSAGMDPNEGVDSGNGEQALLRAIRRNNLEVVKALLEHGASMDVRGHPDLVTPLMLAVRGGSPRMVRLLLEHKANPNDRDDDGHNALLLAVGAAALADWTPDALRIVLGEEEEDDDDDNSEGIYRRTPKEARFEILRALIDAGADLNALADDCGLSALMVAAMYGSPDVTRLLLEKGADPNAGTKDWHALRFATVTIEELREQFSDGGGDPSDVSEEENQEAVAYYNATLGRGEVAELLRKAGARERWEWPDEPKESEQSSDDEQPEETATPPIAAH